MNICEYANNLLSLNILNTNARQVKIPYVEFYKNEAISEEYMMYIERYFSSFSLKVEKEGHEPLYKVLGKSIPKEEYVDPYIMKFGVIPMNLRIIYSWDTTTDMIESYRPIPSYKVKLTFGDKNEYV